MTFFKLSLKNYLYILKNEQYDNDLGQIAVG
ncbi:hypothetical protein Solca_2693 [Solitalea canadensis DSM 3403]|uniref:Uncharacterized protein n=1 Tax=Solitalea canadensis (strain ATCC 29591 / DSM 3403 / JCM 21819 / LMG 8368 / NBRC 15130 / NCIMB 12057 / USAM 9D) TaxID=929556 RepID=H8KRT9_SOLCM|nr:hypothetical protein Solca_2693 [Solitalea canadensis DSM 3403]